MEQSVGLGSYGERPDGKLSVAAAAVIAHEVGHAAQHAQGDPFMAFRQLVVPVAQLGSTIAPWLIIAGVIFRLTDLAVLGLVFFAAAVLFMWYPQFPVPVGVLRRVSRPTHDQLVVGQIDDATTKSGAGDLGKLLLSGETWTVD